MDNALNRFYNQDALIILHHTEADETDEAITVLMHLTDDAKRIQISREIIYNFMGCTLFR